MQQLKGNKPYLWEGIYNGGEDTGPSYETVSYTHLDVYKRQASGAPAFPVPEV